MDFLFEYMRYASSLRGLLRKDAEGLISNWGNRVDFTRNAPAESHVSLFEYSNHKARNRDYAPQQAKTNTEAEDFQGAGLDFALA